MNGYISIGEELEDIHGIFDDLEADANNQITLNKKAHKEVQRHLAVCRPSHRRLSPITKKIVAHYLEDCRPSRRLSPIT